MTELEKRRWTWSVRISAGVLVLLVAFVALQLSLHWEGLPEILVAAPPYLVALFTVILGLSLSRLASLSLEERESGDHSDHFWTHMQKEVGIGFLVSGVALFCIELTMHHAHQRHLHELLSAHHQQTQKLVDIRDDLVIIARATGNRDEPTEEQYRKAIARYDLLGDRLPTIGTECSEWKTLTLDRFGLYLMRVGSFEEAEKQFEAALTLDRDRAQKFSSDFALRRYVVVSYMRLVHAQVRQGSKEKALGNQGLAVKEAKTLRKLAADDKDRKPEANKLLAEVLKLLKTRLVVSEQATEATGSIDKVTPSVGYLVALSMGKTYQFDLTTSSSTLDPYLRIWDLGANVLQQDDDSGGNLNAQIILKCPETGDYWIEATSAPNSIVRPQRTGDFKLVVKEKK